MTEESTRPDIVDQVESASLEDMRNIDIDDVYVQMEWLLHERPTPLDLYNRWEKQNWSTQDLDFSQDAEHWRMLDGDLEGLRVEFQRTFTLFFVGEQAVTDTLSPLVHAAPDEQSRVFLATQLVDEARHSVFFSRFFDEVVGLPGGLSVALAALRDRTVGGFREIFDNDLVEATDKVRADPRDYGAWVEGITIYHLIVEGMLALTGQKFLLSTLREMQMLPGFYAGFTAVARDESRHVNFGVRALMEAGIRDRAHLDGVEAAVRRLLEPAIRTIAAPDRKFAFTPEESPPNLRISPYDVRSFSLTALTKRLRVVGLPADTCRELAELGDSYYDVAWADYEARHGVAHPRRFFDAEMAGAAG